MFGGEGLCKSGLCARTENRQEPGSDRGARWCVRKAGPLYHPWPLRAFAYTLSDLTYAPNGCERVQGRVPKVTARGEGSREVTSQKMKRKLPSGRCAGPGPPRGRGGSSCDMKSALGMRFPERTKGRSTAGLRHQRGIPAHGLPENLRPSPPPTGGGKSGHQSLWRSCGPEAVPWAQSPPSWSCSWGGHLASISCSIRGVS